MVRTEEKPALLEFLLDLDPGRQQVGELQRPKTTIQTSHIPTRLLPVFWR